MRAPRVDEVILTKCLATEIVQEELAALCLDHEAELEVASRLVLGALFRTCGRVEVWLS